MRAEAVIEDNGKTLELRWVDGRRSRFNRFWLRDNCPADGARADLFRSFSISTLDEHLVICSAEPSHDESVMSGADDSIEVTFSDGARDRFRLELLRQCEFARDDASSTGPPPSSAWMGEVSLDAIGWDDIAASEATQLAFLESLARDGAVLVHGLGGERSDTEALADQLGPIRQTDFGRLFDIIVEAEPFTPSQSPTSLDPHTDDPYRYTPSGASILHCVMPSDGDGGASTLVDGFAVADAIREQDTDAFRTLSTCPVPFVHRRDDDVDQGSAVHLRAAAPIIRVDAEDRTIGVRFHERSMGMIELPTEQADALYRALLVFTKLVKDPSFTWQRKLVAGEALVYDNQRVLHGRTGFAGSQTRRHLRLCTIDRDQFHSRLRRLREAFDTGSHLEPLPSGNLA